MNLPWKSRFSESCSQDWTSQFGSLLGQVLWSRGFRDAVAAKSFINPRLEDLAAPFRLKDMDLAARRVADAVANDEPVAVYADYDMDGISGLALLVSFFRACGSSKVRGYQPNRLQEGYGVHPAALDTLNSEGFKLVITVDTGITALEAGEKASELGMDLVITDHHLAVPGKVPRALALVNPNQPGDSSGLSYLSGAGVAFYLAMAVRQNLRERGYFESRKIAQPDLRRWLDLFVLGTIADVVDLKDENRILVRAGLTWLRHTQRAGLKALLDRCLPGTHIPSARDVAFSLTPKLNAASRMGQAELSTELLLCEDPLRAQDLVEQIMVLNAQRSTVQKDIFQEAVVQGQALIDQRDPPVLVVKGAWHEGVLGVVASKLVEKFHRPTIVLAESHDGTLRGSMRTQTGFSCVRALSACQSVLQRFGGHAAAAGMAVAPEDYDQFLTTLWETSSQFINGQDYQQALSELAVNYDGLLPVSVRIDDIAGLAGMEPWGQGNPEPLFLVENLSFAKVRVLKEHHIKTQTALGVDVIGFNKLSELDRLKSDGAQSFDALVVPELNSFRGSMSVQLRVQHVRAHAEI